MGFLDSKVLFFTFRGSSYAVSLAMSIFDVDLGSLVYTSSTTLPISGCLQCFCV